MTQERELLNYLGDENFSVFSELWEEHKSELYRVCLRRVNGCIDDAEDLLNDAMLHAWDKLQVHAPYINNVKGWLFSLTKNFCVDLLRKRKRREIFDYNMPKDKAGDKIDYENSSGYQEDELQGEDTLNRIYERVELLPDRLRVPVVLRFFLDIPYKDIASLLNITNENVRKRIQQARAILHRELKELAAGDSLSLYWGARNYGSSPTWQKLKQEADSILKREPPEVCFNYRAAHQVLVKLGSAIWKSIPVFLDFKPTRLAMKIQTLQQYIAKYPGGWKKHKELAKLFYASGEWDQTVKNLCLVVKRHPQDLKTWLMLAETLMRMNLKQKALDVFEMVLPYVRRESSGYYIQGMKELCGQNLLSAAEAFRKAILLEPGNGDLKQRLGLTLMQAGRPVEAQRAFAEALNNNPGDLVSLTYSYDILVLTGCLKKAGEYVDRVLAIYPYDILALKRKVVQRCRQGLLRGEAGKITKKMLRQMEEKAPGIPELFAARAAYYFYRGNRAKAVNILKNAVLNRDNSPDLWYYYGCWLFWTGAYRQAAEAILKAYRLYKKDYTLAVTACEILAQAGKIRELKTITEDMLIAFPDQWEVCSTAALILSDYFNGNLGAVELSGRAIELQPQLPEAYFRRGRVLSAAGKYSQAIEALKKGWDLLPPGHCGSQSAAAAYLLARCYGIAGEKESSLNWLQQVLTCCKKLENYSPAAAGYWQGKAHRARGEEKEAAAAFKRAHTNNLSYPFRQEVTNVLAGLVNPRKRAEKFENSQEGFEIRLLHMQP